MVHKDETSPHLHTVIAPLKPTLASCVSINPNQKIFLQGFDLFEYKYLVQRFI